MAANWVFFLGVHCTITPTIVSTCEIDRQILREFGTLAVLPKEIRKHLSERAAMEAVGEGKPNENRRLSKFILDMNKSQLNNGAIEKILLVEEAIIGSCRTNVKSGQVYPNIKKNIKSIPRYFDNPQHRICICIKPYHQLFEDCYFYSPKFSLEFDPSEFKIRVLEFSRSWIDVIEDITEHLPNIGVKIWRLDQTKKLRQPIESALFGAAAGFLPNEIGQPENPVLKLKRPRNSFWTKNEIERCSIKFEEDWRYLESGWADYLLR